MLSNPLQASCFFFIQGVRSPEGTWGALLLAAVEDVVDVAANLSTRNARHHQMRHLEKGKGLNKVAYTLFLVTKPSNSLIAILLLSLISCEKSNEVPVAGPAGGSKTTVAAPMGSEAPITRVGPSNGELHVIGVYEGAAPPGVDTSPWRSKCPGGRPDPECRRKFARQSAQRIVKVNVSQTERPIILALTAYEGTLWKIEAADGVVFEKVILAGYHSQDIAGLGAKIPREVYTYDPSPCASCKQGQGHFYSYQQSHPRLKEITGKDPTSFQGRYKGEEFWITSAPK